jgi:hypothetical protein
MFGRRKYNLHLNSPKSTLKLTNVKAVEISEIFYVYLGRMHLKFWAVAAKEQNCLSRSRLNCPGYSRFMGDMWSTESTDP